MSPVQPNTISPDDDTPDPPTEEALADDQLVARIRHNDSHAYETLFRKYVPPLCDFAFRYVRSREEAEDIVQNVFAKLWDNRATIVIHGSAAQFLYTAVRNRARDWLKHELVEQRWRDRTIVSEPSLHNPTATHDANSTEDTAEQHAALVRALAELPARRRIVCTLRWVDDLSYAAIAQRLGISEKTVKNQLARAIEQVRARVRELLG